MTPESISILLQPYTQNLTLPDAEWQHVCSQLKRYLDLILKWNARTNLTAIREPEEIVSRHFGESLFAATHLGPCKTLLDFGSGAGFPGIPIQIRLPDMNVTLAESQGKKAAFLREVCRELALPSEVFSSRVETMPPERQFGVVILRAVDNMEAAIAEAAQRTTHRFALFTTSNTPQPLLDGFRRTGQFPFPGATRSQLDIFDRS